MQVLNAKYLTLLSDGCPGITDRPMQLIRYAASVPTGRCRLLPVLAIVAIASPCHSQVRTWHEVGEYGGPAFWAVGLGSSLFQDGREGPSHAGRTFDGMLVAGGLTEALKLVTHEHRPDGGGTDSFPSGHAALSFAVAASQSNFHPGQAPLWYGTAALIAAARVAGHDHFVQDVLAGAAIGYAAGHLSASSRHGWFVGAVADRTYGHESALAMPPPGFMVAPSSEGRGIGMTISFGTKL